MGSSQVAAPLLLAFLLGVPSDAYMYLRDQIPNGQGVYRNGVLWETVGHMTKEYVANDDRNPFGLAFKESGFVWNSAICQADSDGDGQSNGLELGDPDCIWTAGTTPARTTDISHPGFTDSQTLATDSPSATEEQSSTDAPPTSTTTAPSLGCLASTIEDFDCMMSTRGMTLHWKVQDMASKKVDLAVRKTSTSGWLGLGFPATLGRMEGTHAVVAAGSTTNIVHLETTRAPFPSLALGAIRSSPESATSDVNNGVMTLTVVGAQVTDLRQVELIMARSSSQWESYHGSSLGNMRLNMLTGASEPIEDSLDAEGDGITEGAGIAFLVGALLLIAALVMAVQGLRKLTGPQRVPSALTSKPLMLGLTPFAAVLLVFVMMSLILALVSSIIKNNDLAGVLKGFGFASAFALSLPLWFAMNLGIHTLLGITKEVAFHIHSLMGGVFMAFASVHGLLALIDHGGEVFEEGHLLLGLIAYLLMLLAIVPAKVHSMAPTKLRYDTFKFLHVGAPIGYCFAIFHLWGLNQHDPSWRLVVVLAVNGLALILYMVQRVFILITTRKVRVTDAHVIHDKNAVHVALEVEAPGFKNAPGQWARLHISGLTKVPIAHPFTIVPGDVTGRIRFVIKASGLFTTELASSHLKNKVIRLEGPYGCTPVLPAASSWAQTVVFVAGGIGITPAMSMLPALNMTGTRPMLYWSLRCENLLRYCSPALAPHLDGRYHVQVTSEDGGVAPAIGFESVEGVPQLKSASSRMKVKEFLDQATSEAKEVAGRQIRRGGILVVVCAPPSLIEATRKAAADVAKQNLDLDIHVHEEIFNFIPKL